MNFSFPSHGKCAGASLHRGTCGTVDTGLGPGNVESLHLFKIVQPGNRKSFVMRLPNGHRDQAILLLLVDTGLRAMELCSLRIRNVDLKTGKAEIEKGLSGGAKGRKGRVVYLGKASRRALWRYLVEREDGEDPDLFVFLARGNRPFNPNSLRQLIQGIAERAAVQNAYPHRFRHTFGRSLGRLVNASVDATC